MTRVVTTVATDPHERGRELGAACAAEIAAVLAAYDAIFAEVGLAADEVASTGADCLAMVRSWAPDAAAEIEGIAEGAGQSLARLAALNARSEVLARAPRPTPGECSTSVCLDGPEPLTVQTWDWHETIDGLTLLWELRTAAGRTVRTFTEFGLLGKIGVNDAGLGLHFNLMTHDSDGGTAGVPVHVLARQVLERAHDIDSALALIGTAQVSASVALTLVEHSPSGGSRAVTAEVWPDGLAVVEPDAALLLHTSHFLAPAAGPGDRHTREGRDSEHRLDALRDSDVALRSASLAERALPFLHHAEQGAALCRHPHDAADPAARWSTLATIGLDVAAGRIRVRDGNPCSTMAEWIHA